MQIFFTVRSGISAPQIRDYDVLLGWLVFMFVVLFLQLDTTYTPKLIFMQKYVNRRRSSEIFAFLGSL